MSCIVGLQLTLVEYTKDQDLFASSGLFWLVIGMLLWERRSQLQLDSDVISSCVGAVILGLLFYRCATIPASLNFLKVMPFFATGATALLACGWRHLGQFKKELLALGVFALNPLMEILLNRINLAEMTAKFSAALLWYSGIQVQRAGTFLAIGPNSRIEVYGACSGLHSILQMMNVATLFLVLVTIKKWGPKLLCMLTAMGLGFVVNAGRVALMGILVAYTNKQAFEYWHGGQGSFVFSVIAVILFGGFCWLCFLRQMRPQGGASA
jgi:cyanoexosortase A